MLEQTRGDAPVTLTLRRRFTASPERLFDAWTDPAHLARWWGPPGSEVTLVEADARVGGRYRFAIRRADGAEHVVGGVYRVVERPSRLIFTWRWEGRDMDFGESVVSLTFAPRGAATELHLIHEKLPDAAARDGHQEGWVGIFGKLAAYLGDD